MPWTAARLPMRGRPPLRGLGTVTATLGSLERGSGAPPSLSDGRCADSKAAGEMASPSLWFGYNFAEKMPGNIKLARYVRLAGSEGGRSLRLRERQSPP